MAHLISQRLPSILKGSYHDYSPVHLSSKSTTHQIRHTPNRGPQSVHDNVRKLTVAKVGKVLDEFDGAVDYYLPPDSTL